VGAVIGLFQFFIGLLLIFILLLIAGILGAVGEKKVRREPSLVESAVPHFNEMTLN
jgi:hypothetical protein